MAIARGLPRQRQVARRWICPCKGRWQRAGSEEARWRQGSRQRWWRQGDTTTPAAADLRAPRQWPQPGRWACHRQQRGQHAGHNPSAGQGRATAARFRIDWQRARAKWRTGQRWQAAKAAQVRSLTLWRSCCAQPPEQALPRSASRTACAAGRHQEASNAGTARHRGCCQHRLCLRRVPLAVLVNQVEPVCKLPAQARRSCAARPKSLGPAQSADTVQQCSWRWQVHSHSQSQSQNYYCSRGNQFYRSQGSGWPPCHVRPGLGVHCRLCRYGLGLRQVRGSRRCREHPSRGRRPSGPKRPYTLLGEISAQLLPKPIGTSWDLCTKSTSTNKPSWT